MIRVDLYSLTQPVSIIRILTSIFTCMCFSLVATQGYNTSSYWGWCMFTWVFCFFFTFLIVILEFTTLNSKVPFVWEDFTAAFAMLSCLMCLTTSIIYPTFYTCKNCPYQIGASFVSWVCFGLYACEVALTRLRPRGENGGFLSTVPGIMKMLETFLACLIFTSLETHHYTGSAGLQWCVAVYSLCFIFCVAIILLSLTQLTTYFPISFDKVAIIFNILAAVMYATAMVIWPLYSLKSKRPAGCGHYCPWDKLVVVTFMTIFNFIVYTLDSVYSVYLVFFVTSNQ